MLESRACVCVCAFYLSVCEWLVQYTKRMSVVFSAIFTALFNWNDSHLFAMYVRVVHRHTLDWIVVAAAGAKKVSCEI